MMFYQKWLSFDEESAEFNIHPGEVSTNSTTGMRAETSFGIADDAKIYAFLRDTCDALNTKDDTKTWSLSRAYQKFHNSFTFVVTLQTILGSVLWAYGVLLWP
ncbi:MAG: hypothetical protein Hens2KO_31520 [Henriciella sp.]